MTEVTKADWAGVKLFICDVDGVLTDGTVQYDQTGQMLRTFHIRDGMGMRLLEEAGVKVGIITSEQSEAVDARAKRLLLSAYRPGQKLKGKALQEVMDEFGVTPVETVYIGDDYNDAEAFELAGIPCCPSDASDFARDRVRFQANYGGGKGAVREIAEMILAAKELDPVELWHQIHK
ncbi:MAG: KdsC family phosphatase [Planctomycetota bacterium]|jgi:YrbI family 3-deoxy-D-manno-octulosonate 8-phosphate phosphatase